MRLSVTSSKGFSLVEVTLALGVASIGLATIVGLLSVGTYASQRASQASAAANLFSAVATDLRATAARSRTGESVTSQQLAIVIPAAPANSPTVSTLYFAENETHSASITAQTRLRLTITFMPNTAPQTATLVQLRLTWPAQASPDNAADNAGLFLALDRN
jgi:uncharacterized protein (TIGR02598 family)